MSESTSPLKNFTKKEMALLLINTLREENQEQRRYIKWLIVALFVSVGVNIGKYVGAM